mgnify:CR=1 FL=1
MRTELDQKMDAVMAAMTGEGGQLPLGQVERFGRQLPYIAAAPPTLNAYFQHFGAQHADTEFLIAGDERLTYGQIVAAAQKVARGLVAEGVKKGDRVGIAARNSPSWIVLYMGILMAGGVASLLNGWWQKEGAKMSKSTGNVGDPVAVIDDWGLDAFRYYVVRELDIGPDGNWTDATFAEHAMVVSMSRYASEAGVEILKAGGNAVDAAVATGFALAVTYPTAGNIGGGGFMNIRLADGRTAVIDYRETAPAGASRDMYLGPDGKLTSKSTVGHLASGVPGSVAGMAEALAKYGTMPLAKVMAPAIRLASEGFVVDTTMARGGACSRLIAQFEGKTLFCPGGESLKPGTLFKQPDLARTLREIAAKGPPGFYTGWVADSLVAEEKRGGGIITLADLKAYTPVWRTPIKSTYRGYTLFSMPPASSGGITMTETLNILEQFAPLPPAGSAAYTHLVAEALRRSFTDRNTKLGDPAFVKVPIDQLTSKDYAKTLAAQIVTRFIGVGLPELGGRLLVSRPVRRKTFGRDKISVFGHYHLAIHVNGENNLRSKNLVEKLRNDSQ